MADAVKAAELKNKGNSFLQTGDFAKAIECYTEAIALNPLEHVFYSNRSAAYAKGKNYDKALADARKCVELKPDWGKGYSRLGAALSFLGRHAEAERAYTKGLQLDPTNEQLKSGLEEAKAQAARYHITTVFIETPSPPRQEEKPKDEPMETEPEPEPEVDLSLKQSLEEKEKGNVAYKKKDFETALQHYAKAVELDPTNANFLTNRAGQSWNSEPTAIILVLCRAYSRIGNAYNKQGKLAEAIDAYNRSLVEHRTPDTLKKVQEAEKALKEQERLAYINPEKAEEEREKGNVLFKKGDFPEALKCYKEAIKRDPNNAKLYSNRAACYQKLAAFQLALADCDTCIELDPSFGRLSLE
ncbi:PREDICTED: stress-induced-phosphoprotein 1-like, partial [Acropora digitifera]|uniref:stress-induced-phosphoprotein 1-like n=1 Tax=Acropora digitifera TaxID=70779 RepID=UPI00077A62E0